MASASVQTIRPWRAALVVAFAVALLLMNPVPAQRVGAATDFDVIVVGSEPEGIVAAVAAAEAGARTLLITPDERVGGLFVLAELNVLDLRTEPFNYQRGLFLRWWLRVGHAAAFDVAQAERAFEQMLSEAGVSVIRGVPSAPLIGAEGAVEGVRFEGLSVTASQLIDATADMAFAAAAGAGFDVGFGAVGYHERMADTLVFRIVGLDWRRLRRQVELRGRNYATIDEHVAWGSFGGVPAAYVPNTPGLRLRGLNLGRQADGSVLVNALLIYGLDPFDPDSLAEGRARAEREAPRIVEYLAANLAGFEGARYGGVAERLYIRESRHLQAECTLTVDDVLDNRVTVEDVAAGGYPLDVQTLTPHDSGFVFGQPDMYGVRLCVAVARDVDGLWVVGRSGGYDPLAASSARVVPFGMALAEGVGLAAALAAAGGHTPAALVGDGGLVAEVRALLRQRGAYLPEVAARPVTGPSSHPHYPAYRLMLGRGLAVGGYANEPHLDQPITALNYLYLLSNIGVRFLGDPDFGPALLEHFGTVDEALTPDLALEISFQAACRVRGCPSQLGWPGLARAGLVPAGFNPTAGLTRGEMYELAAGFARLASD